MLLDSSAYKGHSSQLRMDEAARFFFDRVSAVPSGEVGIHCHTCVPADDNGVPDQFRHLLKCGGAGIDEQSSRCAAMGEGLERSSAVLNSLTQDYAYGTHEELRPPVAPPEKWLPFSSWQYARHGFPFRPFTKESPCKWYRGIDLINETEVVLPGPLALFPYFRRRGEPKYAVQTSTGLALADSFDRAAWTGLCEYVERDAVGLAWNWHLGAKAIDCSCRAVASFRDRVQLPSRFRLSAYDITTDVGLPTVMVFLQETDTPSPLVTVGSACRPTRLAAFQKAGLEAVQAIEYVRRLKQRYRQVPPRVPRSFEESCVYYSLRPDVRKTYFEFNREFLTVEGGEVTIDVDDPEVAPSEALQRLAGLGYDVYAVDVTDERLKANGLHVVNVTIPGLYPLEGAYEYRCLSDRRVREASRNTGRYYRYNLFPHPLP